ncbi:MAG: HEAT repeat domain-containing protein [Planctomycetota bacterium]
MSVRFPLLSALLVLGPALGPLAAQEAGHGLGPEPGLRRQQSDKERDKKKGVLDIGPGRRRPEPAEPTTGPPATAPPPGVEPEPSEPGDAFARSAGAVLDGLRGVETTDDPALDAAVLELISLGDAGLSAARAALHSDGVGTLLTGAEVLLTAGSDPDRDAVVARLRGKLPARAAGTLLELLAERDPVRSSPELLAGLLDHPQSSVRQAAARLLGARMSTETLPLLAGRLRSERSETRLLAVELAAELEDPTVRNILIDRLGDATAKVAWRAAQLLSKRAEPEAIDDLLAAAFPAATPGRRACYARLALVEVEDRRGLALVDEQHVAGLLDDLVSRDPLCSGAAALVLAGIGFRGEGSRGYGWLDREVPHEIVRQVSGEIFHRDFSSMVEPAQRRLSLLSGHSFGPGGDAWRGWWVGAYPSFHAHRAVLDVRPEELGSLELHYRTGPPHHRALRFLGPDVVLEAGGESPALGEDVLLSPATTSDLMARLSEEGVFGAERLPTTGAAFAGASRMLEVRVGDQTKRFLLPAASRGEVDAWFDRLAHTLERLEERNRWQRYAGDDARAFFEAEHGWWEAERSEPDRDARLKQLVFAHMDGLHAFERGPGLAELEQLGLRGAVGSADFPRFLKMLEDERYYGERVGRLVGLARAAAGETGVEGEPLDGSLAERLLMVLAARFSGEATREIVDLLGASHPELAQRLSADERPLLRALAAAALGRRGDAESVAALERLLGDSDENVEAAAVLAFAENGLHDADVELLFRARIADPRVRSASLRAVGLLAPEGAMEALVAALAEPHQGVQIAAAEGLADLGDPASGQLLVSLLARGERSPLYRPARRGLLDLGPGGHEALLRAAGSTASMARRDAALVLAEQLVPAATPVLIAVLSDDPRDIRAAGELAVLSAIDFRERSDPAMAWRQWWSTVLPDDPLAWFRAGCERLGLRTPPAEEFEEGGTLRAKLFLVEVLGREETYLVERARRELSRLMGADIGSLPARGTLREAWREELRASLGTGEQGG